MGEEMSASEEGDAMSVWQSRAQVDITDRLQRLMLIKTRLSLSHLASSIPIE